MRLYIYNVCMYVCMCIYIYIYHVCIYIYICIRGIRAP